MMRSDLVALVISYVYVFAVLMMGEGLGRWVFKGGTAFTRKFVHIGVGMWVVGTVLLFESWQAAIIPPLSFVVINYVSYRRDVFKAIELADKRNLGTVYFPISFAVLIALCWTVPAVLVGSLMTMTWGDAMASIVGQRWGKRRLPGVLRRKSWEGSAAMLAASSVSVLIALVGFGVAGGQAAVYALITASVAALLEALTPWGLDNLTVPLASAGVLALLLA